MAKQAVYEFFKIQNRPYNTNDVASHLKEHSKTDIQKALDELVEEGKIMEKVNSKQRIFCIIQQSQKDSKELMRIDKELQAHANELEKKLQSLQKQIKKQEDRLAAIKTSLSIEKLQEQKENLIQKIKASNIKLDKLMATSSVHQDLPIKKRKLEKDIESYTREYYKRKRKCLDILDCILENYPKSKDELYEEIGIDIVNL